MPKKQPNYLFIITDQQRADHLGCYGNDIVQTPNIDDIASKGMSFDQFYVSCPICMPNRATLMTGRTPGNAGVPTNGIPLPLESTTFVDLLRTAGYKTALLGKCHLQNMTPYPIDSAKVYPARGEGTAPPPPLDEAHRRKMDGPEYEAERSDLWIENPDREVETPYYGFEKVRFANMHADLVQGHYTKWLNDRHPDSNSLRGPNNALPQNTINSPQSWRTAVPEELYPTAYVEEMTVDYLEEHAEKEDDAPFFIQCSFTDPHHPWTPPGKYWDMYDPADMPVPNSYHAEHTNPPPMMARIRKEHEEGAAKNSSVNVFGCSEQDVKEILALNYGMITMIDDAIGRILTKLESLGLAEDTVVIFTSDHGDFLGDHGLMLKHCFHNEGLVRVPFIWSDPDQPGSSRTDLLSGTIDIASTILARSGLAPYNGIQGFDVVTPAREGKELPRDGIMIEEDELPENSDREEHTRVRTFITGRWRMTWWQNEAFGELYDREADPDEVNNLWDNPAAQTDKFQVMEMMWKEQIRLQDHGPRAQLRA